MARSGYRASGCRWTLVGIIAVFLLAGCGAPDEFTTPTPTPEQTPTPTPTREPTATATLTQPSSTPDAPSTPVTTPTSNTTPTTASLNPTATRPSTATVEPTPPSPSDQRVPATTTALAPGPAPTGTALVVDPEATAPGDIATPVATIVVTPTPAPTFEPTATAEPTPTPEPTATPELCAGAIPWYEAINHIGEYATVVGPVVAAYWAEEARGKPTFLNVGAPYPDPGRFTVLMWIDARWNFDNPPEETYLGATICVVGTIALYEGSAEMIIEGPEWVWIP